MFEPGAERSLPREAVGHLGTTSPGLFQQMPLVSHSCAPAYSKGPRL